MNENDQNPYQAPESDIIEPSESETLNPSPRFTSMFAGWGWLNRGLSEIVMPQPGPWILIGLIFMLISIAISFIPFIGSFVITPFLAPVFMGGMMIAAHKSKNDEEITVSDLFAGFGHPNRVQLFILGGIQIALIIPILLLAAPVMLEFASTDQTTAISPEDLKEQFAPLIAIFPLLLLFGLLFFLATWLAPPLVALNNLSAFQALKLGLIGCLKNILQLIIFMIIFLILMLVLTLIIGLISLIPFIGFIVIIALVIAAFLYYYPFFAGLTYEAYRDIMLKP